MCSQLGNFAGSRRIRRALPLALGCPARRETQATRRRSNPNSRGIKRDCCTWTLLQHFNSSGLQSTLLSLDNMTPFLLAFVTAAICWVTWRVTRNLFLRSPLDNIPGPDSPSVLRGAWVISSTCRSCARCANRGKRSSSRSFSRIWIQGRSRNSGHS